LHGETVNVAAHNAMAPIMGRSCMNIAFTSVPLRVVRMITEHGELSTTPDVSGPNSGSSTYHRAKPSSSSGHLDSDRRYNRAKPVKRFRRVHLIHRRSGRRQSLLLRQDCPPVPMRPDSAMRPHRFEIHHAQGLAAGHRCFVRCQNRVRRFLGPRPQRVVADQVTCVSFEVHVRIYQTTT